MSDGDEKGIQEDSGQAHGHGGALTAAGLLVAGAAAGYFFYGTKNAKKHRQAAAAWTKKLQRDVIKKAGALKELNAEGMAKVVDEAARAYRSVRSIDGQDLQAATKELKAQWRRITKQVQRGALKLRSARKSPARKVASAKKARSSKR